MLQFRLHSHAPLTIFKELLVMIDIPSGAADTKTGWNSQSWPCIKPVHYRQTAGYNCGVIVCLVSMAYTIVRLSVPLTVNVRPKFAFCQKH